MTTSDDLKRLSSKIDKAFQCYCNAVKENLKEMADEEFFLVGYELDGGLRIFYDFDGDGDVLEYVMNLIRYNSENKTVEVHFIEQEYKAVDYWIPLNYFGFDQYRYIFDNIDWFIENKIMVKELMKGRIEALLFNNAHFNDACKLIEQGILESDGRIEDATSCIDKYIENPELSKYYRRWLKRCRDNGAKIYFYYEDCQVIGEVAVFSD